MHGRLAGGIGRGCRVRVERHPRADIDDQPLAGRQHVWKNGAGKVDGSHNIDIEHPQPFRGLDLQKWCESADARAIDERRGAAKLAADLL